uniref:Phytocyanin domain-containing protein n=2 Tax=Oryza TaxID=4527 RepID=A0A0D3GJY7_9ORYZ
MAGAVATVSVGLAWLGLMAAAASATQFRVGGGRGWSVPDANAEPYNSWAGRMRFQIGDQLLFVYPKETDAVVVVDQGAYDACNTSSPVAGGGGGGRFDDGNTVFTFDRSGPFFFISGNEANCRAGEKLVVV